MHHLIEVWFGWVLNGGYPGIISDGGDSVTGPERDRYSMATLAAAGILSFTGSCAARDFRLLHVSAATTCWSFRAVGASIQHFKKFSSAHQR